LHLGLNGFKSKYFQNLINVIQFAFNSSGYIFPQNLGSEISYTNLGLEIVFLRIEIFENDFVNYEVGYFQNLQSILIGVVSLEFVAFFISIFLYWKTIDVELKKRLMDSRLCFDHFPLGLIMKQTYIMKYLQETSSSLLK